MILLEKTEVVGFESAIRWAKSDSGICKGGDNGIGCQNCASYDCCHSFDHSFKRRTISETVFGKNDFTLMDTLANGGPVHAEYRRMLAIYVDITAPLYWWKEFDTYKVGTVANSCSTMHKIQDKEFTLDDFSHEHLSGERELYLDDHCPGIFGVTQEFSGSSISILRIICDALNFYRQKFLETKNKDFWWQMIQLLPSSYNQKRTVMLNYEVLAGLYPMRKNHKLDEWHDFCHWVEGLPYSCLITREKE